MPAIAYSRYPTPAAPSMLPYTNGPGPWWGQATNQAAVSTYGYGYGCGYGCGYGYGYGYGTPVPFTYNPHNQGYGGYFMPPPPPLPPRYATFQPPPPAAATYTTQLPAAAPTLTTQPAAAAAEVDATGKMELIGRIRERLQWRRQAEPLGLLLWCVADLRRLYAQLVAVSQTPTVVAGYGYPNTNRPPPLPLPPQWGLRRERYVLAEVRQQGGKAADTVQKMELVGRIRERLACRGQPEPPFGFVGMSEAGLQQYYARM